MSVFMSIHIFIWSFIHILPSKTANKCFSLNLRINHNKLIQPKEGGAGFLIVPSESEIEVTTTIDNHSL